MQVTQYPKPDWAIGQVQRSTGLVEDICEHGCGHPNQQWLERNCSTDEEYQLMSVHGCCGCCYQNKPPIGVEKL